VRWSRRSTPELLMALDTLIDSTHQILLKNREVTAVKRRRLLYNSKHSLRIVRVLAARFNANTIVNLKRCSNRDELPWEHERGSGTRGIMRRNWKRYVREKQAEKNMKLF